MKTKNQNSLRWFLTILRKKVENMTCDFHISPFQSDTGGI
ncbi:hypothetical protein KR50_25110 [Jeotgalibacillus campisalis]|uniref:Uncharacterized protein n=1 Tax=Jeotgalibacillus campisalis TaxID=220754 RepID=A0A0C2RYD3_9BACL|nr:hypothetical protein KR50_25110 [Jeotgalibacillus campisalis]